MEAPGPRHPRLDIREDIAERQNRAAEMPDKIREPAARLDAWRHDVGAVMPGPNRRK
jgi:arylsulfatase A